VPKARPGGPPLHILANFDQQLLGYIETDETVAWIFDINPRSGNP
jgi:hypothetical protein